MVAIKSQAFLAVVHPELKPVDKKQPKISKPEKKDRKKKPLLPPVKDRYIKPPKHDFL